MGVHVITKQNKIQKFKKLSVKLKKKVTIVAFQNHTLNLFHLFQPFGQ